MAENNEKEIQQLLDQMATKLKLINLEALKASNFKSSDIDDLKAIHKMVMRTSNFSPREMQAILEEIGSLTKKSE